MSCDVHSYQYQEALERVIVAGLGEDDHFGCGGVEMLYVPTPPSFTLAAAPCHTNTSSRMLTAPATITPTPVRSHP